MANLIPDQALPWFTEDIETKLAEIQGPHIKKKRTTVLKLAFAKANGQPMVTIFDQEDTCSGAIWYTKWQNEPEIKAAYDACLQRALEYGDQQTVAIESYYQRLRRRSLAAVSAKAPSALAAVMLDGKQRGSDRISAANALMGWVDPEAAEKVRPASPASSFEQSITGMQLNELSDDQLDREIAAALEAKSLNSRKTPAAESEASQDDPGGSTAETADA